MSANRVFTDEELRDLGRPNVDALTEAIDAGDLDRAKYLAQRMQRECLAMHDALIDWITGLLTFVGRHYGDEALHDALREGCRTWIEPLTQAFAQVDVRRRAVIMAKVLRGHMTPHRIEEDDEKFTFIPETCPSGGRQILDGKYQPPRDFLKIKNAQPLSFGRENFPVYCAHHLFEELIPQEMVGYPIWITEPAEDLGQEPCRLHLYKNPRTAPKR